ncbi:ATP-dependent DNA helicase PIF1-like protein [Tanacetum coccineum]
MTLKINMRACTDPWFSNYLVRIGDGSKETVDGSYIHILDSMTIPYSDKSTLKNALIDAIFLDLYINGTKPEYIISHAILTTKNENVDVINDELIEIFHGEEKVYYSFDEAVDDKNNFYPLEFLNSLTVTGELTLGESVIYVDLLYHRLGMEMHIKHTLLHTE